jgi:hypothetical protein
LCGIDGRDGLWFLAGSHGEDYSAGKRVIQTLSPLWKKCRRKVISVLMSVIERQLLNRLIELDEKVKAMPTANPKPNLLPVFQQIEELAGQLPRGTAPDLLHYLQKKSYEKARQWLEGRYAEIQKGGCTR